MKKMSLAIALQAQVPVLLWGPPGVGKTSFIYQLGRSLGLPVEVVIASIREPSDFAGLPIISDGEVRMAPPVWAKRLKEAGRGILFLDEISTAPPAVQAALLRVVLDRVIGDMELPREIMIVAAANPPEQAAGGWNLAAPLANRFLHLEWTLNPEEWVEGMVNGWKTPPIPKLPENWETGIPLAKGLVASFIKSRPHLLLQVPEEESSAGQAWPSPRTWEMTARVLAAAEAVDAPEDVKIILASGAVGEGPALEFIAWKRELDLPDPEEVLADPDKFKIPDRSDRLYATLSAVVSTAVRKLTPERWTAAWKVLAKAAEEHSADVAAAAAKALAAARRADLPLPVEEIKPFMPLLTE